MQDAVRIEQARRRRDATLQAAEQAQAEFRAAVVDAASRASFREVAKVAGVRPNTVSDWKKQATE